MAKQEKQQPWVVVTREATDDYFAADHFVCKTSLQQSNKSIKFNHLKFHKDTVPLNTGLFHCITLALKGRPLSFIYLVLNTRIACII